MDLDYRLKPAIAIAAFICAIPDSKLSAQSPERIAELKETIAFLDQSIREHPSSARAHQSRGVAYFELGDMERAIADFDQVIAISPSQEAHHWQRGICYYYAGQYANGTRQFELHQTVNGQDVENAVWHFICKARIDGLEAARQSFIPIQFDSRIPMKEIWALFHGSGSTEEVLEAASPPGSNPERNRQRLCYAPLYLGLYFEANGQTTQAAEHIRLAATQYSMNNYMGMVAQVHARLIDKPKRAL